MKFYTEGETQPIITLSIEKTKVGGEKFKNYYYKLFGQVNKLIEVTDETEISELDACWLEDQNKYTNKKGKF